MDIQICINGVCDGGFGPVAFFVMTSLLLVVLGASAVGALASYIYLRWVTWAARQTKP